ncbi:MAG: sulfotransferase domain-containing protein [Anaerolineae bacterium]|nr:sulfotransferase domain-containing protein [Anaerolineae bacterium]
MDDRSVIIVSGLPRSGTSMMMRMLEAGGIPLLIDNLRQADKDNPKGYYEFEKVKQIEQDTSWLPDAQGKAVKMVSALLKHLPPDYRYKIVFMRREMAEILASQRQMLVRRGEPTDLVSDEKMADLFERHLKQVIDWIDAQPNVEVLYVSFNDVVKQPSEPVAQVNRFLGGAMDEAAMNAAVDPQLYRQRR